MEKNDGVIMGLTKLLRKIDLTPPMFDKDGEESDMSDFILYLQLGRYWSGR